MRTHVFCLLGVALVLFCAHAAEPDGVSEDDAGGATPVGVAAGTGDGSADVAASKEPDAKDSKGTESPQAKDDVSDTSAGPTNEGETLGEVAGDGSEAADSSDTAAVVSDTAAPSAATTDTALRTEPGVDEQAGAGSPDSGDSKQQNGDAVSEAASELQEDDSAIPEGKSAEENVEVNLGDSKRDDNDDSGNTSEESTDDSKANTEGGQSGSLGETQSTSKPSPQLGEAQDPKDQIPAAVGELKKGEAYIPLKPFIPDLTILNTLELKGRIKLTAEKNRQLHVNKFADVSATSGDSGGSAVFGGNMHVITAGAEKQFRFSNTDPNIGGIGFATNYPAPNKASIIASEAKNAQENQGFTPKVVSTFTGAGRVGIGVEAPASKLHVQGDGDTRLINANHWADVSATSTGVGMFGGNVYVSASAGGQDGEAKFRFANTHTKIGGVGFAVNAPDWNMASVIAAGKMAKKGEAFEPKYIMTFENDIKGQKGPLVGIGIDPKKHPSSALDVRGNSRQLSVNDGLDASCQESTGFIGFNAHIMQAGKKFVFSNDAPSGASWGAIGVATNYPAINQLSIVGSAESTSVKGRQFIPKTIAVFTKDGLTGLGTDLPSGKLDVRYVGGRQITANRFADVSANEMMQGYFSSNGYAINKTFAFSFGASVAQTGSIGLATNFPSVGEAAIVSSGDQAPKKDDPFKPTPLTTFKKDGSMEVSKDLLIKGNLRVLGRMLDGDEEEYDFMAAHEALVNENTLLRERMSRMEEMMASLTSSA